jgi:hypothetical protein
LPVARLFATERVRVEVERHLAAHADRAGIDPTDALRVWQHEYLRLIRFVDLDGEGSDPRVLELIARHGNDKATGLLAELLAPCLVFSRDRDLLDTGIAQREWVTLSSAGHDVAQLQAVLGAGMFGTMAVGVVGWELGKGLLGAAKAATLPTLLVGGLGGWLLWRYWNSERGRGQRTEARSLMGDAAHAVGEIWERAEEAERLLEEAAFVPEAVGALGAQVARVVAIAPYPLKAAEVGARLDISTQQAAALLRAPIFLRSTDARYLLGRSYAAAVTTRPALPAQSPTSPGTAR